MGFFDQLIEESPRRGKEEGKEQGGITIVVSIQFIAERGRNLNK